MWKIRVSGLAVCVRSCTVRWGEASHRHKKGSPNVLGGLKQIRSRDGERFISNHDCCCCCLSWSADTPVQPLTLLKQTTELFSFICLILYEKGKWKWNEIGICFALGPFGTGWEPRGHVEKASCWLHRRSNSTAKRTYLLNIAQTLRNGCPF